MGLSHSKTTYNDIYSGKTECSDESSTKVQHEREQLAYALLMKLRRIQEHNPVRHGSWCEYQQYIEEMFEIDRKVPINLSSNKRRPDVFYKSISWSGN